MLLDVLFMAHLVKYLVGAVKKRTVHIFLFQVFINISDGIRPFRRAVNLLKNLDIRLYGIPVYNS